jgi:hypothetical protein
MFTKLFKKSFDPYELGGRWYRFRVSSDGSIIESDIEGLTVEQLSTNIRFMLPIDFCIIDVKDYYKNTPSSVATLGPSRGALANGVQFVQYLTSTLGKLTPYVDIYAYCVKR